MANSSPKVWKRKKTVSVAAGATIVIDALPKDKVNSLEYDFDARKSDDSQIRSFKMYVTKTASDIQDTVFARLEGNLNINVQSQINGTDIELQVTNNELFDINVNLARATI